MKQFRLLCWTRSFSLIINDVLGSEIQTIINESKDTGAYEVEFNAEALPSGFYFYRVVTGNTSTGQGNFFTETKKMVLLR